ncbi:MAG: hypothetical protein FWE67_11915, partial [Planctomycetaceae bacterium]|nr:hypothetical protein [Planctomycetaceae bacterium]
EAQSYQFRPDKVAHFLNRNLDLLTANLPVSTYFVDVFTSIPPVDFYDRDGKFYSRAETWAHWTQAFDTIRTRLSKANKAFPSATTSSEAGMDSLIGHLDGADCQFMLLSEESGEFRIPVKCKKWSRVPWFDAVHHNVFSLHGVGYSGRYEAQRGRALHGIDSDDYITSEILTGHALMTDWGSAKRNAVRKYWLAQDIIRHLADKHIVKVEFADNDIQRMIVTWNDGTAAFVNTGETDWDVTQFIKGIKVADITVLPQYGFYIGSQNLSAAIAKVGGRVVEFSYNLQDTAVKFYVNSRQRGAVNNLCPVIPKLKEFKYLGKNEIQVSFDWDAKGKIDKDWCIFVHCTERRRNWHHKPLEAFLGGGGYPQVPTSQWKGTVNPGEYKIAIPDELPAGRYYLVTGLYDSKGNGGRAKLMGLDTGADRYAVTWLKVERKADGSVSNISTEPFEWKDEPLADRLLSNAEPVNFIDVKAKGAFRFEMNKKTATLTPLPDEPASEVALNFPFTCKSIKAVDADGKELRDVPFKIEEGRTVFTTKEGEFAYILSP